MLDLHVPDRESKHFHAPETSTGAKSHASEQAIPLHFGRHSQRLESSMFNFFRGIEMQPVWLWTPVARDDNFGSVSFGINHFTDPDRPLPSH